MSIESFPGNSSPSSAASPEQTRPSAGNRLQEALKNPELQREAKEAARRIGGAALRGAMEGSGVVKTDRNGDTKVSKFGVAKALLRPKTTALKAAKGALSGTREGVIGEAFHQTQNHMERTGQRQSELSGAYASPVEIEGSSWSEHAVEPTSQWSSPLANETQPLTFGNAYAPDTPTTSFQTPTSTYEQPTSPWTQPPASEVYTSPFGGSHTPTVEAQSPFSFSNHAQQNEPASPPPFKWS